MQAHAKKLTVKKANRQKLHVISRRKLKKNAGKMKRNGALQSKRKRKRKSAVRKKRLNVLKGRD